MAVHEASFVCVTGRVAGTTRIRYVEMIRILFASQADYVSMHGSFPAALGFRAARGLVGL